MTLFFVISEQWKMSQVWRVNGKTTGRTTIRTVQRLTEATICNQGQLDIICIERPYLFPCTIIVTFVHTHRPTNPLLLRAAFSLPLGQMH